MLEKLPIKKEYLLIAGAIVLLLLSYQFAFKHTIDAWQTRKNLQARLATVSDINYQPGYLERKSANIGKILSQYKADTSAFRNEIINTISAMAEKENVKLTEVPVQDSAYRTKHFIVEKLGFDGDYFSLVRLAHDLQTTNNIGAIRSEEWKLSLTRTNTVEIKRPLLVVYLKILKK